MITGINGGITSVIYAHTHMLRNNELFEVSIPI